MREFIHGDCMKYLPDYSIKNWIERKQKRILDRMEK